MIGTSITDWSAVEGGYYAGMGGEAIWLIASFILCTLALIFGSIHEKKKYNSAK